jgi:hypothetical protein
MVKAIIFVKLINLIISVGNSIALYYFFRNNDLWMLGYNMWINRHTDENNLEEFPSYAYCGFRDFKAYDVCNI